MKHLNSVRKISILTREISEPYLDHDVLDIILQLSHPLLADFTRQISPKSRQRPLGALHPVLLWVAGLVLDELARFLIDRIIREVSVTALEVLECVLGGAWVVGGWVGV